MSKSVPTLVTHSGKFHCDDAFAYATLRLALGISKAGSDHRLIRTRDRALIAEADIVFDVGAVFDPITRRFDHHQRGAPMRDDERIPYSAAGLVWQIYGTAAVRTLLLPDEAEIAESVAKVVDKDIIRRIDALDNGVGECGHTLELSSLVEDFNGTWDSKMWGDAAAEDAAFMMAADLACDVLRRRVNSIRARLAAEAIVIAAHQASNDPRILELNRGMPWKEPVFANDLPVIYAVYPVPNGNWMVDSMPPEPHSFSQRLPLPAAWAGLQDETLALASGINDAVFVHVKRFVGAARSRAGAMEMATRAIAVATQISADDRHTEGRSDPVRSSRADACGVANRV